MTAEPAQLYVHGESTLRNRLAQMQTRVAGRLKLGLYAKSSRYGLCRDLALSIEKPSAKIPIAVRPLREGDLASLLSLDASQSNQGERLEVAWRRAFVDKGARGGFVAIDQRSETPCYVQWLFGSRDNDFIQRLGGFPVLEAHEALLENAYTPPNYRGLGIMSAAMALIAERASEIGARHVLTFVDDHNIASLKGCQRAGFYPQMLHHRTRLGFGLITRDRFEKLRDGDPRRTAKF
jgi:RimJ/RimL family protein N-acetyltransferase